MNVLSKVCTKCGVDKPLDQYYASKLGPHGRASRCKACKGIADRARRAAMPRVIKPARPAPSNPLLAQIDTIVSADSRDMVALSRASNLSPNSLLAWRRASKRGPGVFPLMRLLDTLGYELVIRKRD